MISPQSLLRFEDVIRFWNRLTANCLITISGSLLVETREVSTNRVIGLLYTYAITYVITRILGPQNGLCVA